MKRNARSKRNTFFGKMKTVFFVFTEAHAAVFMLCGALLELLCGTAIRQADPLMSSLCVHASAGFALLGLLSALWVIRQARQFGIIGRA